MSHADEPTDASESRLATAVSNSRVVTALGGLHNRLSSLGRGEHAARLGAWTRRVVTNSFAYRWFTAEPEPDMIVIDLRETVTVSPFVALLDRLVELLDTAATSSGTVAVCRSLRREFRAAPVRLFGAFVALGSAIALLAGAVLGRIGAITAGVLAALALAGLAGTQVSASWADIVDSRVGGLVIAALEPPADGQPVDANDRDE
jgi:small-conductance mechanosensitive channel